jgi:hypothetical protein
MHHHFITVAWITGCLGTACSRGHDDSEAVAAGLYIVSAPVCVSTGKTPNYPSASHKLALFDFSDETNHTLAIGPQERLAYDQAIEVWTKEGCELSRKRNIVTNKDSDFSFMQGRDFSFVPTDCTLPLTYRQGSFQVGAAYSDIFSKSESHNEEIAYEVEEIDASYILKSKASEAYYQLWRSYGCGENDQISITLKEQSPP